MLSVQSCYSIHTGLFSSLSVCVSFSVSFVTLMLLCLYFSLFSALYFSSVCDLFPFFVQLFALVSARIIEFLNRRAQWWSLKGAIYSVHSRRKEERGRGEPTTLDDVVNFTIVVSYSISKWLNFNLSSFRLQSRPFCIIYFSFFRFRFCHLHEHLYQDTLYACVFSPIFCLIGF